MTTATESLTYGRFTVSYDVDPDGTGYDWVLRNESGEDLDGYKTKKEAVKEAKRLAKDEEDDAKALAEEEAAEAAEEAAQDQAESDLELISDYVSDLDASTPIGRARIAHLAKVISRLAVRV